MCPTPRKSPSYSGNPNPWAYPHPALPRCKAEALPRAQVLAPKKKKAQEPMAKFLEMLCAADGQHLVVRHPLALCCIAHLRGGREHPPTFTVMGLTECAACRHRRRDCISARPACPSNENKRVYSFILCILLFWPRLGFFSNFFCVFCVFWVFSRGIYIFHLLLPIIAPFFSPTVYVLPCLEHILSRRVSVSCTHHGIQIRNNGTGVHIETIKNVQYILQ